MANKACIVAVWYGRLPEYFSFWERSCGMNEHQADFLLVTDQSCTPAYPNIRVLRLRMAELKEKIGNSLKMTVSFDKPFKACDFRPAFGVIFGEELKAYEYWGHCDLDQVFGDLSMLLERADLGKFDKIGRSGHLTLYRNISRVNNLFREDGALYGYETVFQSPANYAFDERTGICRIAKKQQMSYLNIVALRADIRVRTRRLEINGAKNYQKQLFYWENGHLYRAFLADGQICTEEFLYLHFQKKKLRNCCGRVSDAFFIGREGFFEKIHAVTAADFDRYNPGDSKLRCCRDTVGYYFGKLMDYCGSDPLQKQVWLAQKKIGHETYD